MPSDKAMERARELASECYWYGEYVGDYDFTLPDSPDASGEFKLNPATKIAAAIDAAVPEADLIDDFKQYIEGDVTLYEKNGEWTVAVDGCWYDGIYESREAATYAANMDYKENCARFHYHHEVITLEELKEATMPDDHAPEFDAPDVDDLILKIHDLCNHSTLTRAEILGALEHAKLHLWLAWQREKGGGDAE